MLECDYYFIDSGFFEGREVVNNEFFHCSGPKGILFLFSRGRPSGGGQLSMHLVDSDPKSIINYENSVHFKEFVDDSKLCSSVKDGKTVDRNPFFEVLEEFYKDFVMTGKVKYVNEVQ